MEKKRTQQRRCAAVPYTGRRGRERSASSFLSHSKLRYRFVADRLFPRPGGVLEYAHRCFDEIAEEHVQQIRRLIERSRVPVGATRRLRSDRVANYVCSIIRRVFQAQIACLRREIRCREDLAAIRAGAPGAIAGDRLLELRNWLFDMDSVEALKRLNSAC
jgi:hypothetical protein